MEILELEDLLSKIKPVLRPSITTEFIWCGSCGYHVQDKEKAHVVIPYKLFPENPNLLYTIFCSKTCYEEWHNAQKKD